MMHMAIDAAGFSAKQADHLRRAMDSRRSAEKMEKLKAFPCTKAWPATGSPARSRTISMKSWRVRQFRFRRKPRDQLRIPVYSSRYLKRYFPAAFYAGLLNAQPMGFLLTAVADCRCPPARPDRARAG